MIKDTVMAFVNQWQSDKKESRVESLINKTFPVEQRGVTFKNLRKILEFISMGLTNVCTV